MAVIGMAAHLKPTKLLLNEFVKNVLDLKYNGTGKMLSSVNRDIHLAQCLRERVDIALEIYESPDPEVAPAAEAMLKEGAEFRIWIALQEALTEAGWQITPIT